MRHQLYYVVTPLKHQSTKLTQWMDEAEGVPGNSKQIHPAK